MRILAAYIFGIGFALAVAHYTVEQISPSLQHSADVISGLVRP